MNYVEAVAKLTGLGIHDNKLMRRSEKFKVCVSSWGEFRSDKHHEDYSIYRPSINDILAEDWYVVKDEKLHTFGEVLVAFRAGKTISREDKNDQNLRYKMGWSKTLHFKEEDLLANDWLIIDKEETK